MISVTEPLTPVAAASQLLPFQADGVPHYIAYQASTGAVSFRRIEADGSSTSSVWEGRWEVGFAIASRVAPAGKERFAYYRPSDGLRYVSTFGTYLQDRYLLNYDQTQIDSRYTHGASDVPPELGVPLLYWYDKSSGSLHADMLRADDGRLAGGFTSSLARDYRALAAVDGRLLGFYRDQADVYGLRALAGGALPGQLADLPATERVLAFQFEELSLLVCYSLVGAAQILRLTWTADGAEPEPLWQGHFIEDATSLSGLELSGEYLIFVHDALAARLQLVSVTRASPE